MRLIAAILAFSLPLPAQTISGGGGKIQGPSRTTSTGAL